MSRTGIIAPMPVEAAPLIPAAARKLEASGRCHFRYEWESAGTHVSLACSGVGMRKAAEAARWLLDELRVDRVIVCGVAGGLAPGCRTGSLVLPQEVRAYTAPSEGGFIAQGPLDVGAVGPCYPVDAALREVALGVAAAPPLEGLLVSVRGLVTQPPILGWLHQGLSATAIDMESAAAAEVCSQSDVPFLVIRALSDHAPELARWDWAGLARARKRGRLALAAHFLGNPALTLRLWRLQRDMDRGARLAAGLTLRLLNRL